MVADAPELALELRRRLIDRSFSVRCIARDACKPGHVDFLPSPVDLDDLVARIIALSRRSLFREPAAVLEHRGLRLNVRTRTVTLHGQAVELTNVEYRVLQVFMQQPGLVLSRRQLWDRAWDATENLDSNLVQVYMSRLRSKLRAVSGEAFFQTIRGAGYTLR